MLHGKILEEIKNNIPPHITKNLLTKFNCLNFIIPQRNAINKTKPTFETSHQFETWKTLNKFEREFINNVDKLGAKAGMYVGLG